MRTYYVGMDVHRASIVIVVLNGAGKIVMHSVIETGAERVRGFLKQLRGKVGTPHRFRSKHQFWTYVGLAVVTRSTADHEVVNGVLRRSKRPVSTRGLNRNHNHLLKRVFKNAATSACHSGPFKAGYDVRVKQGMAPSLARLTIARQLAATTLAIWKRGEQFDPESKKQQTA
jgi:hypothetical protein